MNSLLRLAGCAGFLGLCVVVTYALFPCVPEWAGMDLMKWIGCQRMLDREATRTEELSRRQHHSNERILAKDRIARDLIAGRMSLAEAARRFGALPHAPAPLREQLRADYVGASEEECMCRHVIEWACQLTRNQPGEAEALRRRLEEELRANLRPTTVGTR